MPFKSNLSFPKFGFNTFPANNTFLQSFFFRILIILPNCPIETGYDFLSFLNFFYLDKSIIKYLNLFFLIFFRIFIGKLVSPNIKPIILLLRKRCTNRSFFVLCYKFNNIFN